MSTQFLCQYLVNPGIVGNPCPSSRALCCAVAHSVLRHNPRLIAEWGAGQGHITRALLSLMQPHQRLIAFELLKVFVRDLQRIADPRLTVIHADLCGTRHCLAELGLQTVDCICSSIPINNYQSAARTDFFQDVKQILQPGGYYIQYAYIWRYHRPLLLRVFPRVETKFVFANFPPAFVYSCTF